MQAYGGPLLTGVASHVQPAADDPTLHAVLLLSFH